MTPETEPVVLRRVFPAEVSIPDPGQVVTNALAVVTRERVYVWVAAAGDPPRALVLDAEYSRDEDAPPMPRDYQLRAKPIVLDTDFGQVTINLGRGCGCGNPLKSWQPFVPARSAGR